MEEEEIKIRFAEEILSLGVPKKVIAAQIGFTPQTFTNVTQGRNLPGALLLNRIHKSFPAFDINYVITGIKSSDDSHEVESLKRMIAVKDTVIEKLAKHKGATTSPGATQTVKQHLGGFGKGAIKIVRKNDREMRRGIFAPGSIQKPVFAVS